MHSRIIELSRKIVEVDDRICEDDYYDNGFIGNIADYVAECNRIDAIEWFAGYLQSRDVITEFDFVKMVFSSDVKEKFFRDKYEEFKKLTSELSFEEFTDSFGMDLYRIQNCISEKFGFYVHYDGCYYTLDNFIRECVKDGETWYIGGVLDYHC